MAMSAKDFRLIASVIRTEIKLSEAMFEPHHVDAYNELACKLAHAFAAQNPRFDAAKFLAASNPMLADKPQA
jgi:hypothetical protein